MGEHSQPEPKYRQPNYELESPVPKLDLPVKSVEEILDLIERRDADQSEPSGRERALQDNQLDWELGLLPDVDPEHSIGVIDALDASDRFDDKLTAVAMTVKLYRHNRDAARLRLRRFLGDSDFDVRGHVPDMLEQEFSAGEIDTSGVIDLMRMYHDELEERDREIQSLLRERRRAVGRTAARPDAVHIHAGEIANSIIGDGVTRTYIAKPGDHRGSSQ
ncbi:hypothetical protein [Nocardia aurea]|uniref:hypothetical protein n=1 Tax=Nocardia aurea TaxID=2144174 RepID=UPI001300BEA8|nr:hypothetical protein [Nocardia aurea]